MRLELDPVYPPPLPPPPPKKISFSYNSSIMKKKFWKLLNSQWNCLTIGGASCSSISQHYVHSLNWNHILNHGCHKDMNMNMTFAVECTFFQVLFLLWRSCSLLYCILYWCKAPYASMPFMVILRPSHLAQVIWPWSFSPLSNLLHRLKNKIYHIF